MSNRRGIGMRRLEERVAAPLRQRLDDMAQFAGVLGWRPPRIDRRKVKRFRNRQRRYMRMVRALEKMADLSKRAAREMEIMERSFRAVGLELNSTEFVRLFPFPEVKA